MILSVEFSAPNVSNKYLFNHFIEPHLTPSRFVISVEKKKTTTDNTR